MESGVFQDFQYPEKYAAIVEKAEGGDEKSVIMLKDYYSNFPRTDLRNLEYWSNKSVVWEGKKAHINLIVALASHNQCERAWSILGRTYSDRTSFPFYSNTEGAEFIDEKCERKQNQNG